MKVQLKPAIKICGVTKKEQALKIASLGTDAIGVVGVNSSKRYLENKQRRELFQALEQYFPDIERVWVVSNPSEKDISECLTGEGCPSVIQLHGKESYGICKRFKEKYPKVKWWKALRIRQRKQLLLAESYQQFVDAILFDTWSAKELGGTGKRLPLEWFSDVNFQKPWWLAGGVSAEWVPEILAKANPYGIDASSKIEKSPGIKDIEQVELLIKSIKN
ncbi:MULTISPECIES: phosphoribosylanthranilate isomerase [Prochlorococcus]|uniref:phosphoribosylanthranilate isomerase n=1 Tax=Prochlorococcus TaxID=1218 RepID=UPI000533BB2B|nr:MULTISPECIES: phosphoribosylanthranilate isomerase [Prochlorococcus]KGG12854.1 Phosphoribosylanthranilate isomerase [Prochlorococcus sp. MIT 0601]